MKTSNLNESSLKQPEREPCRSYILSHLETARKSSLASGRRWPGPAVTISYQTGSGAHEIAERLAGIL